MSDGGASIAALVGRVKLIIGRFRITQSDDSGAIQMIQGMFGPKETMNLKRVAEYGFQSWPPDGCDGIAVFLGGDRSNGAVIATHDLASRFKLGNKGEAVMFDNSGANGAPGRWVWFKLGDAPSLEIEANNTDVVLNNAKSVTLNITGDAGLTINMNGKPVIIKDPGSVVLSDQNGEKALVRDGDPVSTGGHVSATQTAVKA